MLIRYGTITLADDYRGDAVSGFRINGRRVVEVQDFPGATEPGVFARGNHSTSISFSVTRLWRSAEEAMAEMIAEPLRLADQTLLAIGASVGGNAATMRYLPRAALESHEVNQVGATTFHTYGFSGPRMTTVPPKSSTLT